MSIADFPRTSPGEARGGGVDEGGARSASSPCEDCGSTDGRHPDSCRGRRGLSPERIADRHAELAELERDGTLDRVATGRQDARDLGRPPRERTRIVDRMETAASAVSQIALVLWHVEVMFDFGIDNLDQVGHFHIDVKATSMSEAIANVEHLLRSRGLHESTLHSWKLTSTHVKDGYDVHIDARLERSRTGGDARHG